MFRSTKQDDEESAENKLAENKLSASFWTPSYIISLIMHIGCRRLGSNDLVGSNRESRSPWAA